MNFELGNFFNIFKVGEKLGHGHFAEVKHCYDKENDVEYAAKFIRLRQSLDSKSIGMSMEEIEREAHVLKMLNHQNIIKLFYCYDLGKNVVLLLELVSGGELFDHISDSEKLSEEEASEFIEQILLGVNHMHERKVVHLDLKPENVMIEDLEERKIKLIDFGLARELKKQDTIIEMQGTAEFLAPEVINYNPISYATDMWAIGVITYIMLTGVSPFSADDQFSTFQNIINCSLDFSEDVCSDMTDMAKSFINSLLVLSPKKRATASSCLKHHWIKPMEQATVFRRRSSIISRDKLQSLKQFVVYPSPPSSSATTPRSIRKFKQESDLLEDVEDVSTNHQNDDDLVLLNSVINNKANTSNRSSFEESYKNEKKACTVTDNGINDSSNSNNDLSHKSITKTKHISPVKTYINDITHDDIIPQDCEINNHKSEDVDHSSVIENPSTSKVISNDLFVSKSSSVSNITSSQNCEYVHSVSLDQTTIVENSLKQKFNNSIANSVRKLNSKFESITSLFDTKNKLIASSNIHPQRGSLKSSLNINARLFITNDERVKQSILSTERSTCYDETVKSNVRIGSVSVATSPNTSKKSMFMSRYMAHIENRKN